MSRSRWLSAAVGFASIATLPALAIEETSLERWSTVEIREATEAIDERWDELLKTGAIDVAPADIFAEAREAVDEALSGRRWDDDRERIYWIYQANRKMDLAEVAAEIAVLESAIEGLTIRRAALDEVRIEREALRLAAQREAEMRAREQELARREAELALAREAMRAEEDAKRLAEERERLIQERLVEEQMIEEQLAAEEAARAVEIPEGETVGIIGRTLPLLADIGEKLPSLVFEGTRRGPMLVLQDLLFEVDGPAPESRARSQLEALHGYLAANPDLTVSIEGHWDTASTPERAELLSEARAEAVRAYLLGIGLPSNRVSAQGFGNQQPIVPGATPQANEQNRRVELILFEGG